MNRSTQWIVSQMIRFAAAATLTASVARATDFSWNNSSNGVLFFSDANNWTPNGAPGANDTSTFSLSNSYEVRFVTLAFTKGLTVSAGNVTMAGFVGEAQDYDVNSAANSSVSIYNTVGNTSLTLGDVGNLLYLYTQALSVGNGAALNVHYGSQVVCASFGSGLNGNITVDGTSAQFNLAESFGHSNVSLDQYIGSGGGSGSLTIQNGAGGGIHPTSIGGPMSLHIADDTTPSTGVFAIHGGSSVSSPLI